MLKHWAVFGFYCASLYSALKHRATDGVLVHILILIAEAPNHELGAVAFFCTKALVYLTPLPANSNIRSTGVHARDKKHNPNPKIMRAFTPEKIPIKVLFRFVLSNAYTHCYFYYPFSAFAPNFQC